MNKAKLPTKTKIAAWWLYAVGIVLTIWSSGLLLVALLLSFSTSPETGPVVPNLILFFFLPPCNILIVISGISLINEKRNWQVATRTLSVSMICLLGVSLYSLVNDVYYQIPFISLLGCLTCLMPLILILLDRKNYFEMVRQRELEKKGNG